MFCCTQIQDIEREHVPLPGRDAGGQDIRAGHRHGGRVLDAVRGAQAIRVAAAVGDRGRPVHGAADRAAVVVRARRHHAGAVRAPQPARAPRTVPHILPAETVQQFLRQRAQRDRRVVRGRRAHQVDGRVRRRPLAGVPATRIRPLVRPSRRASRRQYAVVRAVAVPRGDRGAGQRGRAGHGPAHGHRDDAQLVLQQRQHRHADVVGDHGRLTAGQCQPVDRTRRGDGDGKINL